MNMDNIKGAGKKIEGTMESAYGDATGDTSSKVKGSADKAQGKVLNVVGKIEDAVSDLASCAANEAGSLKTQIKEKPIQSSLIALAVGIIVGKLLG